MTSLYKLGKPLISVIIPIYNAELHLDECLFSLLRQTYNNFEIILINDGSTDKSETICLQYKERDNRVRYYKQANLGVSAARNKGIKLSAGTFITFVDSDDWVAPNYLNVLYDAIKIGHRDLACVSYFRVETAEKLIPYVQPQCVISCRNELASICYETNMPIILGGVCGKLYKASIIRHYNIVFPRDINYCEDNVFNIEYYKRTDSAILLSDLLYFYRAHSNEVSLSPTEKMILDSLKVIEHRLKYFSYADSFDKIHFYNESIFFIFSLIRKYVYFNRQLDKSIFLVQNFVTMKCLREYINISCFRYHELLKTNISVLIMKSKSPYIIVIFAILINKITKLYKR